MFKPLQPIIIRDKVPHHFVTYRQYCGYFWA